MQLQLEKLAMAEGEYTNQDQAGDINEKLLLDLAWERQQKKVRVLIARVQLCANGCNRQYVLRVETKFLKGDCYKTTGSRCDYGFCYMC